MRFFNFFKTKKPKQGIELTPSPEHIYFSECVKKIIEPFLSQYNFQVYREEIQKHFTTIIYRNEKLYIKVSATTHPLDYPYTFGFILGEGDSEDFFKWDWNSIPFWRLKQEIIPKAKTKVHSFPCPGKYELSLKKAKNELLKYGVTFLNGDLKLFIEARKKYNKEREPYKIILTKKD